MTQWGGRKVQPLVLFVCDRDGWVCWLCGDTISMTERSADHDPPRSDLVRAGEPYPDDPQFLHAGHLLCNKRRGRRPVTDTLRAELKMKRRHDMARVIVEAASSPRFARRRAKF